MGLFIGEIPVYFDDDMAAKIIAEAIAYKPKPFTFDFPPTNDTYYLKTFTSLYGVPEKYWQTGS